MRKKWEMGKSVRFCDSPRIVEFGEGYARWTCDRDGSVIPMRVHRSMTYRKIVIGKFYYDFLNMVMGYSTFLPGMVDFAKEVYKNISIITNSDIIDEFLINNKLYEYLFLESISEEMLISSIYEIIKKQTLFMYYNQNILEKEILKFQTVLYEHDYFNEKFYIYEGILNCTQIYKILIQIFRMYLVHPDLIY